MTLEEALSISGSDVRRLTKEELKEVLDVMVRASRSRLDTIKKYNTRAYQKMYRRAGGTEHTVRDENLELRQSRYGVEYIGIIYRRESASINELRSLRKSLYDFLKNPTSTVSGHFQQVERLRERLNNIQNPDEPTDYTDESINTVRDYFINYVNNTSQLIYFAQSTLNWDSEQIKEAILECGGYSSLSSISTFNELKEYIWRRNQDIIGPLEEEIDNFDYNTVDIVTRMRG